MKILLTGGAGFIGSNVADRYLDLGHKVIIVDNLSTGRKRNLNPKAKFYQVDICDSSKMAAIFKKEKPDIVNHHAAQMDVRRSTREPIFDAQNNIVASLDLIENCLRHKVKKIIYANTGGALYGEIPKKDLPIDESYPIDPICQYGVSKHTVEHYLYTYSFNYGLSYVALRYANIFGPRQDPHGEAGVIAIFCGKILENERPIIFGDGKQTRDYTYVGDVVSANIAALNNVKSGGYHIGTGEEISVNQIFEYVAKILDFRQKPIYAPARVGEISCFSMKNSLAKKELGWQPECTFKEGLESTINWYKNIL